MWVWPPGFLYNVEHTRFWIDQRALLILGSPGSPGSQPQTKQWMGARGGVGVQEKRAHKRGEAWDREHIKGAGGGESNWSTRVSYRLFIHEYDELVIKWRRKLLNKNFGERNWVFVTNFDFLITIYLSTRMSKTFDITNYFLCWIKYSKLEKSKVYTIRLQRYRYYNLFNLNYYPFEIKHSKVKKI